MYNWTDDLPKCKDSGIGFQSNLIYRAGGGMGATTDYEDRSFNFSCPGNFFLYGVLDGHDGPMVADFAVQRLPAELLLGQIEGLFLNICIMFLMSTTLRILIRKY